MSCRSGHRIAVEKGFIFAGVLVLALFLLCSCDPMTRYKTLSIFFDGVPNPEEEALQARNVKAGGGRPKQAAATYKMHGPYAARLCSACHRVGTNVLVLPIEKLCFNCHVLQLDKKYVHGPVAAGGCKICHDPHGSSFPYLLVSEARNFCLRCHNEKDIAKNEAHQGVAGEECTDCHDAHSSDKAYLLK
jgi:predicted CXXCH cytochrome family protein